MGSKKEKGKSLTEEQKRKISEAMKSGKRSELTKSWMSALKIGESKNHKNLTNS